MIHQLAFSLGAGLIWAAVFGSDPATFIPFLTVGFAVWGYLAGSMIEGCGTFVVAHGYLKQLPLNQTIFIHRTVIVQSIYAFVGILTAVAVSAAYGHFAPENILYSIPGILLLLAYSLSSVSLMAYLGIRFRDIQHALGGIFNLLFVCTPVIYPPSILTQKGIVYAVYINPFASLIEIVREPLLHGRFADDMYYIIAIFFVLIVFCLSKFSKNALKNQVAFLT